MAIFSCPFGISITISTAFIFNSSNSKTSSAISSIRKIQDLKRKYNNMNFQQKLHLKNTFNQILRLKNNYNSLDKFKSKTIDTEANDIKKIKSKEKLLIQNTDQLSLINPSLDKDLNSNLYFHTISNIIIIIPIINSYIINLKNF